MILTRRFFNGALNKGLLGAVFEQRGVSLL